VPTYTKYSPVGHGSGIGVCRLVRRTLLGRASGLACLAAEPSQGRHERLGRWRRPSTARGAACLENGSERAARPVRCNWPGRSARAGPVRGATGTEQPRLLGGVEHPSDEGPAATPPVGSMANRRACDGVRLMPGRPVNARHTDHGHDGDPI
jgi:hypothetical protein